MTHYVLSFFVTFALAAGLTPLVRVLAFRYGMVAMPVRDRWHQKPTALLGGVAIFIAFWLSSWLLNDNRPFLSSIFPASILLFLLGLLDDFLHIKPATKLIGQIIAACLMIFSGIFFHWHPLVSVPVSILWYVGLMNAFNLLDNIDGLAAGVACIASITLGFYMVTLGQPEVVLAAMALAGATLGFLVYNTHPAGIFMGDCGSLCLGHLLATLALTGTQHSRSGLLMALLVPVLLVSVPIFDTLFVTLTRFFHARPISQGGKDHTSHRLVAFGVSQRKAVWILYGISIVSCSVVLLSAVLKGTTVLALAILLTFSLILFGMFLGEVKIQADDSSKSRHSHGNSANKKGFMLDILFQHKRRISEVLMDFTLIYLAYYGAFFLKFDGSIPTPVQYAMVGFLPVVIVCQLLNFFIWGLYRGVWKYIGIRDVLAIVKAITIGTAFIGFLAEWIFKMEGYSRPVLIIFFLILLVLVSSSRIAMRAFFEFLSSSITREKKVVIIGASDTGELLLRLLQNSHQREYKPVAFIDNNPKRIGKIIHGIPVLGGELALAAVMKKQKIDVAFVTTPSVSQEQLEEIREECRLNNVAYRVVGAILEDAPG